MHDIAQVNIETSLPEKQHTKGGDRHKQTSKSCRTFWRFVCITKIKELLCLKIIKITYKWIPQQASLQIMNKNQTRKVYNELNQTQNYRFCK